MIIPYFDAHCDTLSYCASKHQNLYWNTGQVDLRRLEEFDPVGQVFAIFADSGKYQTAEGLDKAVLRQLAIFQEARREFPQVMAGCCLAIEGAELLHCDPDRLVQAAGWGVRSINLTWNHANALCGSHCDDPGRGLSRLGETFVREMERLGILVDVSHLSDSAFWDLADWAERPFIASHSNSRALCRHSRNLTDAMFRRIRDGGGVVGINFYDAFVHDKGRAVLLDVVAHIEHFLNLEGEDTVCLGGDFDGSDGESSGLAGVQDLPRLWELLYRRNYPEKLLDKLFYENLRRVLPPAPEKTI